ncbi:MAG: SGNH/GDSL hydrolase family protein [Bacteroidetes bacterium]|nr:SGNH/GDSL hydrolase family protein [Bacteroidota bacterium]
MKNIIKITIPVILLIAILFEILFRTVLTASEHPFFYLAKEGKYIVGKYNGYNGYTGQYVAGVKGDLKALWHINQQGWNSPVNYVFERKDTTTPRIAIIGDSYVEALNVDSGKSFSDHLRNKPGNRDVYSFGIGGSPLSQHLNISRYVNDFYNPDIAIITIINNDFDESLRMIGDTRNLLILQDERGRYREFPPDYLDIANSPLRRVLKKSATIRYMFYNMKLYRFIRFSRSSRNEYDMTPLAKPSQPHVLGSHYNKAMESISYYLLSEIKEVFREKRVVLLMDAQRKDIFNGKWPESKEYVLNEIVAGVSDSLDIELIDLTPLFLNKYEHMKEAELNRYKHLIEIDGHWDEADHLMIADTLAAYLGLE